MIWPFVYVGYTVLKQFQSLALTLSLCWQWGACHLWLWQTPPLSRSSLWLRTCSPGDWCVSAAGWSIIIIIIIIIIIVITWSTPPARCLAQCCPGGRRWTPRAPSLRQMHRDLTLRTPDPVVLVREGRVLDVDVVFHQNSPLDPGEVNSPVISVPGLLVRMDALLQNFINGQSYFYWPEVSANLHNG